MDDVYSRIGVLLRLHKPEPAAADVGSLLAADSFESLHSRTAMLLDVPPFDDVMPKRPESALLEAKMSVVNAWTDVDYYNEAIKSHGEI